MYPIAKTNKDLRISFKVSLDLGGFRK